MKEKAETATRRETVVSFGPFRIEGSKRLWRGDLKVKIRPRPLAVLHYLVERPQRLVTKEELLKQLWPGIYVTTTVLKVCVREIRQALSDTAASPKFVETVGTQGYRFIGLGQRAEEANPKQQELRAPSVPPRTPDSLAAHFVGRVQDLAILHAAFARAQRGERQLLFISGEAGIGKTTLVDYFVNHVQAQGSIWVGRGYCIEQQGAGEAYLPVLGALGDLCRLPGGAQIITLFQRYAPMWLLQLPGLLGTHELETLQRQVHGNGRERMLRELVEALSVLAADRTVLLVLEDLQWSDVSTIEFLAYLAQRRESTRVLVIGTYRSSEVVINGHPVRRLVHEIYGHRQCEEISIELLTELEVEEYLKQRFPESPAVHALSAVIYHRTDGNALFMTSFVDYLLQHGHMVHVNGRWEVRTTADMIVKLMPQTVQRLISKQFEERSTAEQQLLTVASTVGVSFTAAEVAGVTGRTLEEVEENYEGLANREQFIEGHGSREWPNQILVTHYRFRHALYQQVLYGQLGEVQRLRFHRQLGEWLARAYGERAGEIAGELALHFEEGRDTGRAVRYRQQAGENALRRNAYTEAQEHLTHGLTLLSILPDTAERKRQELRLRLPLDTALRATRGFVASQLEQNRKRSKGDVIDGSDRDPSARGSPRSAVSTAVA